ncbi:MAG: lasso peptide biosynthesis protein [Eubacterium sp.]|nr:lasso peptide biosynthesis protein [Eubacterium sp.]
MDIKSNKTEEKLISDMILMKLPGFIITFFLGFFLLDETGAFELSLFFALCYFVFFLGVIVFMIFFNKTGWIIPGSSAAALLLIVIFRDAVITVNILYPLIAIVFFLLISSGSGFGRFGFLIFTGANLIFWIIYGTDNKLIVVAVIAGVIYGVMRLLKKNADYSSVIILALLLIFFLPVSSEPIKWTFVKRIANGIASSVERIVNDLTYWMGGENSNASSYTGYSGIGTITGNIEKSSREEMIFKRADSKRPVYLRGSAFKTLTKEGFTDKEGINGNYNEWLFTFINALMNAEITSQEAACFTKTESAEVKFRYLRTKDVLYPETLIWIDDELKDGLNKKKGKGFKYHIKYMTVDYASPYFLKVVTALNEEGFTPKIYSYEEASEYARNLYHIKLSDYISEEQYSKYKEKYKKENEAALAKEMSIYLDDTMATDKIRSLTREVTSGCENDFEKAKMIEIFLRNYKYDTYTDLTGSDNYIEDFLFEVKKGYCVHYASAMVLMLRTEGIPARYVSGYYFTDDGDTVMSSDAHAWVEAYIRGVGWVTFEPTAICGNAENTAWNITVREEDVKDSAQWEAYYQEKMKQYEEEARSDFEEEISDKSDVDIVKADEKNETVKVIQKLLLYVGLILGSAAVLLAGFLIIRWILYKRLPADRKLQEMVKHECKVIEKRITESVKKNKLRGNNASLFDYLEYAQDEEERNKLKKLFERYYLVRFRGDSISENEIKELM